MQQAGKRVLAAVLLVAGVSGVRAESAVTVSHVQLQAVDEAGRSTFVPADGQTRVTVEGILLNVPEQWLDPTPDSAPGPWQMGGQWEIFIQGQGLDHAGTACWMGQNYGNGPGYENYSDQQWRSELWRLNHDPATGHVFRPGDRVRVTGRFLFYAGKLNINENHEVDPAFDFTVALVDPAAGLPQPEPVRVCDLVDADNRPIFDSNRLRGPEYYQMRLVRLEDVTVLDPEHWGPGSDLTLVDANGLTFPVHLCCGRGFVHFACPTGLVDVIGVMDQKAPGFPPDPRTGYRILVLDHDGSELTLGCLTTRRGNLPEDVNADFTVDQSDRDRVEAAQGQSVVGLVPKSGP